MGLTVTLPASDWTELATCHLSTWVLLDHLYTWVLSDHLYTWVLSDHLYTWVLLDHLYTWVILDHLYTRVSICTPGCWAICTPECAEIIPPFTHHRCFLLHPCSLIKFVAKYF